MPPDPSLHSALTAFDQGDLARAKALARNQIEGAPSGDLFHLLGVIECRSGNLEAGIAWFRRARELEPEDLKHCVMLARALVDRGRAVEALEIAQPPSGYSPPELALWHVRAEAADAALNWNASAEAWGKLAAARPNDWRASSNRAHALGLLRRWAEAVECLQSAVQANPLELPLRQALASALSRVGRFQESADELGKWVEASEDSIATRILYARLLADLGSGEESNVQLDKASRLVGGQGFEATEDAIAALIRADDFKVDITIARELALLFERTGRLEALETIVNIFQSEGLTRDELGYAAAAAMLRKGDATEAKRILESQSPSEDVLRWHWLMSRICDSLGETEKAFSEAVLMNQSQEDFAMWLERGRRHVKSISELADLVTPDWAAGLKTLPSRPGENPAFVVGFPRSGTTLLDTFLMGHPSTIVLEEIPLINAVGATLGDMKLLPARSITDLRRARAAYFEELKKHTDRKLSDLLVDKLPLNMLGVPYLYSVFPDASFVFVQRHPCDAVLSGFMQSFVTNDSMACFLELETAAKFYDAAMRLWTHSREAVPIRVHTIVYEKLIAEPRASLEPLIAFLGLEWRDDVLDHQSTAKARASIGTPSYNQVTQPLTKAPSGRWKRYSKQLAPVLPILMPWAERLGYSD